MSPDEIAVTLNAPKDYDNNKDNEYGSGEDNQDRMMMTGDDNDNDDNDEDNCVYKSKKINYDCGD